MSYKKEQQKKRTISILSVIFIVSIFLYFNFYQSIEWVSQIMPEFISASWFGIMILYGIKKTTKLDDYLLLFGGILIFSFIGFMYGKANNIIPLIDLMPELIGTTSIGVILSVIFKKKMML